MIQTRCAVRTGLCKGSAPRASGSGWPNFVARPPEGFRAVVRRARSGPQSLFAAKSLPSEAFCPVDPAVARRPISYLEKLAAIQQTLGVDRALADELSTALDSDECSLPQEQGLDQWLTELANCWKGTGLPIVRVVPVLQKQPGLRFVRVETIHSTLTWLCGFFQSNDAVLEEVEKHPQWLTIDASELHANTSSFKAMGFSDETVRQIARIAPPKIALLAPEAPQKLRFMETRLGRSPSSVLGEFPRFCVYSLSNIIAPRVLFVLHLQHPACYDFPDLRSICTTTEARFCSNVALAAEHQYQQFMETVDAQGPLTP